MTPEELTKAITAALDSHGAPTEEHKVHHEFVKMLMEERENRRILWRKFKLSFVGAIAISIVTALIWIGKFVLDHLGVHLK